MSDDAGDNALKSASGRVCGDCSLCCFLPDIQEADKSKTGWCRHCRPGRGGCSIYETRPNQCREYACTWLSSPDMPDYWRPTASRMVVDFNERDEGNVMRIWVHPNYPNRWREEPFWSDIGRQARVGLEGTPKYETIIVYQREWKWLVLPDKVVPYGPGVYQPLPGGRWDFLPTQSREESRKLSKALGAGAPLTNALSAKRANPDWLP